MGGAVWFTDPDRLLPLIARRLAPGGVLAFAHAEPTGETYGPQSLRGPCGPNPGTSSPPYRSRACQ
ncbi:hypothetical protein [Streptomyces spectabilis]|uniref:Class I SAM-dependent methyltransferase n=1 Tax=Streptomyces spectabilis TaxID=68270 RepID=A0A5P2X434_STRST|nr:hypothetical protein [Streptomyces spectabilis]MBB5103234.1 hypothetical protein [Streptomyces spectabilis]MCI3902426.1 hypothetical protein [Streptomyces spectabilis]QEV59773.1 hypothetical protein CP982_14365 [Streptomyces spectabilis]GGV13941.1 hypothetical protein GCM10010245_24300 [Streptomyces spectabilis]